MPDIWAFHDLLEKDSGKSALPSKAPSEQHTGG